MFDPYTCYEQTISIAFSVDYLRFFTVAFAFPAGYYFECNDGSQNPPVQPTVAAEGYKDNAGMFHCFTEERMPTPDLGRSATCNEDSTGLILSCPINWYNSTTPQAFTFSFNAMKLTASATLTTTDGVAHVLNSCRYGGN